MTPLNWQDHDLAHPLELDDPHWIEVPDLFADGYDDATRDQYFAVMALTPRHTYMLATEWPARMVEYFDSQPQLRIICASVELQTPETRFHNQAGTDGWWPLPNFLPGVLVRTQREADERVPVLLGVQAVARFVLAEPREAVDIRRAIGGQCYHCGAHPTDPPIRSTGWTNDGFNTICNHCGKQPEMWRSRIRGVRVRGGDAPMHPDHVRSLRDQCAAASVPFALETWGEWAPASIVSTGPVTHAICRHGCVAEFTQGSMRAACSECNAWEGLRRVGRAASGRLLDGVQHDAYPQVENLSIGE